MSEIRINQNEVTLVEEISVFGKNEVIEERLNEGDEHGFEVKIASDGYVPLDEFMQFEYNQNGVAQITICPNSTSHCNLKLRKADEMTDSNQNGLDEPPKVPELNDFENESRRTFYQRLKKAGSQPYLVRKIVYNAEELTREELGELMEERGYEASSGGIPMTLVLLDEDLDEISRIGRGDSQIIRWTGTTQAKLP